MYRLLRLNGQMFFWILVGVMGLGSTVKGQTTPPKETEMKTFFVECQGFNEQESRYFAENLFGYVARIDFDLYRLGDEPVGAGELHHFLSMEDWNRGAVGEKILVRLSGGRKVGETTFSVERFREDGKGGWWRWANLGSFRIKPSPQNDSGVLTYKEIGDRVREVVVKATFK